MSPHPPCRGARELCVPPKKRRITSWTGWRESCVYPPKKECMMSYGQASKISIILKNLFPLYPPSFCVRILRPSEKENQMISAHRTTDAIITRHVEP